MQLAVGCDLVQPVDRSGWNPVLHEQIQPFLALALPQYRLNPRDDLLACLPPVFVGAKTRIGAVVRIAHRGPETAPDAVVSETERDRRILRVEALIDGDHAVARARAPRKLARAQKRDQPRRHDPRHAYDHGDVERAALAVRAAPLERGGYRHR